VVVSKGYFHDLQNRVGGAIYCYFSGELSVLDTTFLKCSASGGNLLVDAYGGGLCNDGTGLNVERCCFHETKSETWGSAISYTKPATTVRVSYVSFHACYGIGGCSGTIDDQQGATSSFPNLTFTFCSLNPSASDDNSDGVAILCRAGDAQFTLSYSVVLNCIGSTGIDTKSNNRPEIRYCNFYHNRFTDGTTTWALFYAEKSGLIVTSCIFNNNSNIFLHTPSFLGTKIVFTVTWCVFSGSISTTAGYYSYTANNYAGIVTASHPLTFTWLTYSPTASPTRSRSKSPSPTRSRSQSSSGTISSNPVEGTPQPSESRFATEEFTFFPDIYHIRYFLLRTSYFLTFFIWGDS
jgi:hypothetical protein